MIQNLQQLLQDLEQKGASQEEKETTAYIALMQQDLACLAVILNILTETEITELAKRQGLDQLTYAYFLAYQKGYDYDFILKSAQDIVFSGLEIERLKGIIN